MRRKPVWSMALLLTLTAAFAESGTSESMVTKTLLDEVRQLRQDLQSVAATIQRVQIGMYRLQSASVQLDKAKSRLEQTRSQCEQAQQAQRWAARRIEEAETRQRDAANSDARQAAEASLKQEKSNLEMWTDRAQKCQVEQIESENQVRDGQARMAELSDQLDRFDKLLAAYPGK